MPSVLLGNILRTAFRGVRRRLALALAKTRAGSDKENKGALLEKQRRAREQQGIKEHFEREERRRSNRLEALL